MCYSILCRTNPSDILIQEILDNKEPTKRIQEKKFEDWISPQSHDLFRQKAKARRYNHTNQLKPLQKLLRQSLQNDRTNRVNKTAMEAQDLLKNGGIIEAYHLLQKWYRNKAEKTTNPTYESMDKIQEEYQQLYASRTITGDDIPTYVRFNIIDSAPEEPEIIKALKKLKNGKSPGASGISVDEMKTWYFKARLSEHTTIEDTTKWNNIIKIVQIAFKEGTVPVALKRGILKLLPKPRSNGFRGIALLESIYKLISMIIHLRIMDTVEFHESIHGFRRHRGTATAIINLKLQVQLARREKKPLYMIFLDLKKAYDSVDRTRTLKLLENYGLGKNIIRIIQNIWEDDVLIPKQQMYYGKPFTTQRGVKQGDIVSPTLFNIIIDAVVRHTLYQIYGDGINIDNTMIQFYADDGIILGENYELIQQILDRLRENFLLFGLEMNLEKTEMMIIKARQKYRKMTQESYDRKITGVGESYNDKQQMMVSCHWCDKLVQRRSLKTHLLSAACTKIKKKKLLEGNIIQQHSDIENLEEEETHETKTYQFDMPLKTICRCPCESCKFQCNTRNKMRRHFRSRHLEDIIIINEEGLLPQCVQCGIFQSNVNSEKHLQSEDCKRYAQIKNNKRLDRCNKAATNVKFQLNNNDIKKVNDFKYLGRIIDDTDDDLKAVENQLKKARATWGRIGKILKIKTDSNIRIMSIFYKVIIQTILLYGSESWVINEKVRDKLRTFHNRCARFITGCFITKEEDGTWIFPETKKTLQLAHLLTVDDYITKRRDTIFNYAMGTEIYSKCKSAADIFKSDNKLEWWRDKNSFCVEITDSEFDVAEIPELGADLENRT